MSERTQDLNDHYSAKLVTNEQLAIWKAERDKLCEQNKELVEALKSATVAMKTMKLYFDDSTLKILPGLPAIEERMRNVLAKAQP